MPNTIFPTQIGSTPPGSLKGSTVVIGKNDQAAVEAVGIGPNGRPDYVSLLTVNLYKTDGTSLLGTISFDALALQAAQTAGAPASLQFVLKEVAVCDSGQPKKMMVLASQTYT